MEDRQQAQQRIIAVMRDNVDSVPYLVGWLTAEMSASEMETAVDRYFAFDEMKEYALLAMRHRLAEKTNAQE